MSRFWDKFRVWMLCINYTLVMAALGIIIFGATHQNLSSQTKVVYTRPTYTVTFDPNGGTCSTSSKPVKLGDTYSDLPTPTRTGYTFNGWKSKNLITISDGTYSDCVTVSNGVITIKKSTVSTATTVFSALQLKANTEYTVSCNIKGTFTGRIYAFLMRNGASRGSIYSSYLDSNGNFSCTYTTSDTGIDTDKGNIHIVQGSGANTDLNMTSDEVVISNIMLCEGPSSNYEDSKKAITSSTQNITVGDHTLTAQWTPNNYKIIYYENKNILDGGEFRVQKDLTQNGWYNNGASITTADGLSCAKMSGALTTTKYVTMPVFSGTASSAKIKFSTDYIVSIKCKVVNYVAGTTNPFLALYMDGNYNKSGTPTWYSLMGGHNLGQYSGQGWKDIFYDTTSNSSVSYMTAINAGVFVYARDFTGDIYFRDYSIAEATNTSRTVTFDKSPGAASVLSYSGYDFQGYYTQPVGGIKIYNADGSVVKGVSGYTDSNGNWKRATETKLYGQWKGWDYLPDSAGATFTNTQALQNSSGGRNKRVVQINTTKNASGTARTFLYCWDGLNYAKGASLVEKSSQGDQTLYVRVYPTGGEHYRGYVQTSTVVHLNKLPMPYVYGRTWTGISGGWYMTFQRKCGGALVWGIGSGTSSTGLKITSWTSYDDDNQHRAGDWSGPLISMTNTYTVKSYHSCNGYIDSDTATTTASGTNSTHRGGQETYYRTTDDGQLTT